MNMDKIKKLLSWIGLGRELAAINPDAERDGVKRFGKGLAAVAVVAIAKFAIDQTGTGCVLGEGVCHVLQNPTVQGVIIAGILGAEKYANEKWGIGMTPLDSSK